MQYHRAADELSWLEGHHVCFCHTTVSHGEELTRIWVAFSVSCDTPTSCESVVDIILAKGFVKTPTIALIRAKIRDGCFHSLDLFLFLI